MLFRRFAFAVGLVVALIVSQVPEFLQQYRQRVGGALDELAAIVAAFDSEAGGQSLTRAEGIARLKGNDDVLARQRGASMEGLVARRDRLDRQRAAFAVAGPVSQYAVLAEDFDPSVARQALADYEPALPATPSGVVGALVGFAAGWMAAALLVWPLRRAARRRRAARASAG